MTNDDVTGADRQIRQALADHAKLRVDVSKIADSDSLYELGLTSHASVNVMLALEDSLDIEFPDELLRKSTFESIHSIETAIVSVGNS